MRPLDRPPDKATPRGGRGVEGVTPETEQHPHCTSEHAGAQVVAEITESELVAEMHGYLRGKQCQQWRHIHFNGAKLTDPKFTSDGVCSAAGDVDRVTILRALITANRRQHDRRSASSKRAAQTRAQRVELLVYRTALRLIDGGSLSPSTRCIICRKRVTDEESIARGIGAECWQGVLAAIARENEAAA
jgi:hypothetical protein